LTIIQLYINIPQGERTPYEKPCPDESYNPIVMPEISVNVEGRLNGIGMDGGPVRGIYKHGKENVNGM
jgi:hypothetical protein